MGKTKNVRKKYNRTTHTVCKCGMFKWGQRSNVTHLDANYNMIFIFPMY